MKPLSEEELLERDKLVTENPFKDWMRRDFNAFIRACEKHGRESLNAIAKEVESKSEDEVKAYAAVFWERYSELPDHEKYLKQIERGEQKIQRQQDIMKVRHWSCSSSCSCSCPWSCPLPLSGVRTASQRLSTSQYLTHASPALEQGLTLGTLDSHCWS